MRAPAQGTAPVMALLRAEVAAARLEAACAAEPGLGNLWRNEAAVVEAVRSVGMEDVKLSEADLLRRIADDLTNDVDARGAEVAAGILRVLRAPRDLLADPEAAIARIEGATGIAAWSEAVGGFRFESGAVTEDEARAVAQAAGQGATPLLAALRGAALYGVLTGRHNPVAERLIFASIESAMRQRQAGQGRGARGDDLALLSGRIEAGWVSLPGTALCRAGFRIWSPASVAGLGELLGGFAEHLEAEIGGFARLRHWARRAQEHGAGRHGKSRFLDLIALVQRRPLVTSAMIADTLGVTRRTALNLVAEAEALDLLRPLTGRRSMRIWATPMMAERMTIPGRRGGPVYAAVGGAPGQAGQGTPVGAQAGLPRTPQQRREAREAAEAGMARAMAEFDAALGAADALLSGMKPDQMRGRGGRMRNSRGRNHGDREGSA